LPQQKISYLFNEKKIAQSDYSSFAQLHHTLAPELYSYAYKLPQEEAEADDALRQCFVKLWEQRSHLAKLDRLTPYLYRAIYNTCLNIIRHRKVVGKSEAELALDALFMELEDPETEAELAKNYNRALLNCLKKTRKSSI